MTKREMWRVSFFRNMRYSVLIWKVFLWYQNGWPSKIQSTDSVCTQNDSICTQNQVICSTYEYQEVYSFIFFNIQVMKHQTEHKFIKTVLIQSKTQHKTKTNYIENNIMEKGKTSYPAPDESLRRLTLPPVSAGSYPNNMRVDSTRNTVLHLHIQFGKRVFYT